MRALLLCVCVAVLLSVPRKADAQKVKIRWNPDNQTIVFSVSAAKGLELSRLSYCLLKNDRKLETKFIKPGDIEKLSLKALSKNDVYYFMSTVEVNNQSRVIRVPLPMNTPVDSSLSFALEMPRQRRR